MKKANIVRWIVGNPMFTEGQQRIVVGDNEMMVASVRNAGLPMDTNFGHFDDLKQAERVIPAALRNNPKTRFIIRCPRRSDQKVFRKLFVTWPQLVKFVNTKLPGGYREFRLGIREVSEPIYSGTMICSGDGQQVAIELWKGRHLKMDQGSIETSHHGIFQDDPVVPRRFIWSENCPDAWKQVMLEALRFFAPNLRPTKSFYTEFNYTTEGFRFIGLSLQPFWCEKREVEKKPFYELWGD